MIASLGFTDVLFTGETLNKHAFLPLPSPLFRPSHPSSISQQVARQGPSKSSTQENLCAGTEKKRRGNTNQV